MFFVLDGAVSIQKGGEELARVGKGTFFGEMTFLLGLDRSASAVALEPWRWLIASSRDQTFRTSPPWSKIVVPP